MTTHCIWFAVCVVVCIVAYIRGFNEGYETRCEELEVTYD